MAQSAASPQTQRFDSRWLPLIVTTIGGFMSILDSNIVNIALDTIMKDFHTDIGAGEFVITAYIMALAVMIPLSGFLGERMGFKRLYIFTIGCFTFGSALCGLAWNLPSLIAFRVIQGIGGGMLQPLGMAIVFQLITPLERPKFVALLAVPQLIAPIMGPSLGGFIVQYVSWRWVFYINIPIGLIDIGLAAWLLQSFPRIKGAAFDVRGFMFGAIGFPSLVFALGEVANSGTVSPIALLAIAIGVVFVTLFIRVEWSHPDPLLNIHLFSDPLFRLALSVQYIGFFSLFGLNFILPLYLQIAHGWGPAETGLALLPMGIVAFITVNLSAKRYNQVGPRPLAMIAMGVLAITTFLWTRVSASTGIPGIIVLVCFRGLALGFFSESLQMCTYNAVPQGQIPRATALVNTAQRMIGAVTTALIAMILIASVRFHGASASQSITNGTVPLPLALTAFRDVFFFMTGLSIVGIFLASFLRDRVLLAKKQSEQLALSGQPANAELTASAARDG